MLFNSGISHTLLANFAQPYETRHPKRKFCQKSLWLKKDAPGVQGSLGAAL
jgi:hypothetical protein